MQKKIVPFLDRVLVERIEPETKTPGGIVIPDSAKQRSNWGHVVAVGVGKPRETLGDVEYDPCRVKVGQSVLFSEYAGTNVKHGGKEYLLLKEDDIMAVLE